MSSQMHNMGITRCPYDSTQLIIDENENSFYTISCPKCSSKWETNNAWVERVNEPDWAIVNEFQEEQIKARELN